MKPNFALNLSHDGIGLLHRTRRGWQLIGEVSLDDPEFAASLTYLRKTAASLSNGGLSTKLIVPNSQVLYTVVPIKKGGSDAEIRASLKDLTPYKVDELAFDWIAKGNEAQVAAVALETLAEAEAFASEHRLNALSFVAIPDPSQFDGEPFFGLTAKAPEILDPSDPLEPDTGVMVVAGKLTLPEPESGPEAEIDTKPDENDAGSDAKESTSEAATPETDVAADVPPETVVKSAPPPSVKSKQPKPTKDAPSVDKSPEKVKPASTSDIPAAKAAGSELDPVQSAALEDDIPEVPNLMAINHDAAEARTVFGARKKQVGPKKSPSLALVLTLILLVVMAALAIWSTIASQESATGSNDAIPAEIEQVADTSSIPAENAQIQAIVPASDLTVDADEADGQLENISLQVDQPEAEPLTQLQPAIAPMTRKEAEVRYSATGIWALPPNAMIAPQETETTSLYVASIDPVIRSEDAVALPPVATILPDDRPDVRSSPAPKGSVFNLGENGLVIATPEGTLSPEGVRIYAGRPAFVPRPRPSIQTAEVETENPLAGFRPTYRPEDLVQKTEIIALGGRSRAQLASIKPIARPETIKLEEETDQTPTEQAVARSTIPRSRPKNIDELIALARKQRAAAPQAVAVANAPRSAAPSIPTSASVARQATIKNAINLRKVNLVGIYGSSSQRRALIRLPSGKYIKVGVGDRVDGGKVAAIGESELRYIKSGRNIVLKMPNR